MGDDADWLRRPRVRGISPGKGGPRNSRRLAYRPSPRSRGGPTILRRGSRQASRFEALLAPHAAWRNALALSIEPQCHLPVHGRSCRSTSLRRLRSGCECPPEFTGWAQINGGRRVGRGRKRALDELHVQNASFWLDIRIISHDRHRFVRRRIRKRGAIEIAQFGRRESDLKHADKALQGSQAWRGSGHDDV